LIFYLSFACSTSQLPLNMCTRILFLHAHLHFSFHLYLFKRNLFTTLCLSSITSSIIMSSGTLSNSNTFFFNFTNCTLYFNRFFLDIIIPTYTLSIFLNNLTWVYYLLIIKYPSPTSFAFSPFYLVSYKQQMYTSILFITSTNSLILYVNIPTFQESFSHFVPNLTCKLVWLKSKRFMCSHTIIMRNIIIILLLFYYLT